MSLTLETYIRSVDGWLNLHDGIVAPPDSPVTPPSSLPATVNTNVETIYAGAVPIGTLARTIPVGAVYVNPTTGSDTNAGTQASPWKTIQKVLTSAASGSTAVLRGGLYHESLTSTSGKHIILQNYPGEVVWLDGSVVLPNAWTSMGGGVYRTPYTITHARPSAASYPGLDPNRALPDQVWVNGVALAQIADNSTTPAAGQFSVNQSLDFLYVHLTDSTTPAGKEVRAADLAQAHVGSSRIDMYGIGVRRYSPQAIDGFSHVMIYANGAGTIMENCWFTDSAMSLINIVKPDNRVTNCTFQDAGLTGILTTTAGGLLIEKCLFRRINRGKWNQAPIAAAVKMSRSRGTVCRWNWIEDVSVGNGLWYDVSCTESYTYGNYVDGRDKGWGKCSRPLFQEISDGGIYDGVQYYNYIVGNLTIGGETNQNVGSGYTQWWNNEFRSQTLVSLYLKQDRGMNTGGPNNLTPEIVPWWNVNVSAINNVFEPATGAIAQMIAYDGTEQTLLGWDMFERIEGNWFRPAPPGSMVQLGDNTGGVIDGSRTSYNTLAALAASGSTVGGPPGSKLGTNYQGTAEPSPFGLAKPITATVAPMLGVTAGTQTIGPNMANLPVLTPEA